MTSKAAEKRFSAAFACFYLFNNRLRHIPTVCAKALVFLTFFSNMNHSIEDKIERFKFVSNGTLRLELTGGIETWVARRCIPEVRSFIKGKG